VAMTKMEALRAGARRRDRPRLLVEVLSKEYPAPAQWPMIRAFHAWSRALPKRVVANARPVSLERGVLIVHVTSPMWAQELTYLAPSILESIAKVPGAATVRSMKFRVAKLPDAIPLDADSTAPLAPRPPAVASDGVVDAALTTIGDESLRKAVESAAAASRARSALASKKRR